MSLSSGSNVTSVTTAGRCTIFYFIMAKYNYTFFQDMFREHRNGKYSTKKVWGFVFMVLISVSYVLDGLHFYKVNENLFNSLLIAGTTLLGMGVLQLFSKKDTSIKDKSNE